MMHRSLPSLNAAAVVCTPYEHRLNRCDCVSVLRIDDLARAGPQRLAEPRRAGDFRSGRAVLPGHEVPQDPDYLVRPSPGSARGSSAPGQGLVRALDRPILCCTHTQPRSRVTVQRSGSRTRPLVSRGAWLCRTEHPVAILWFLSMSGPQKLSSMSLHGGTSP